MFFVNWKTLSTANMYARISCANYRHNYQLLIIQFVGFLRAPLNNVPNTGLHGNQLACSVAQSYTKSSKHLQICCILVKATSEGVNLSKLCIQALQLCGGIRVVDVSLEFQQQAQRKQWPLQTGSLRLHLHQLPALFFLPLQDYLQCLQAKKDLMSAFCAVSLGRVLASVLPVHCSINKKPTA